MSLEEPPHSASALIYIQYIFQLVSLAQYAIWRNLEKLIPHLWYTKPPSYTVSSVAMGGDSPGAHQRQAGADLPKADRRDPEPHAAGPRRAPAPGEGGLARGDQDNVPHGPRLLHLAGDAASTGSYYYTKHSSQTGLLQVRQDNQASIKQCRCRNATGWINHDT